MKKNFGIFVFVFVLVFLSSCISINHQTTFVDFVKNAASELAEGLDANSVIAVLNVSSTDSKAALQIVDELEFDLMKIGKFKVVDRRQLDQIRTEQNFQISGEVSDDTAVSIGNMLGANIVIVGEHTISGLSQRLVLKALDVQTGAIKTMSRQQIN
jgi:curli biogenesis system outer membrane secretion channel CsgG